MANQDQPLNHEDALATSDDARIKTMLQAIAVPENLNERIKSRLRTAMLVEPCLHTKPDEPCVALPADSHSKEPQPSAAPQAGRGERSRRAMLIIALAATLSGLAFLANQWRQPNEREWLVKHCQTILGNWEQDNPANLEIDANLAELPSAVRDQLARVTLRGTRSLAELGSKFKGTLYRLDAADGHSLTLLKLSELPAVRGLTSRFSILPTPSGGWSLIALQLNNETYVLAAECTEQQLMNYIRRPVVT